METWRLVISGPADGAANMAVDEAIMNAVRQGIAPPTIRLYQWSPPAVSLGYFQSLEKEIDLAACKEAGVDVVRRLTGGRAVLHQSELTYSVTAPEENSKIRGSVLQSYLAISRGLVKGLSLLGVEAELSEGKKRSGFNSAACFDAPSWYEMVVNGKKLVGSAQTRRNRCLLQHGSMLTDIDADLLFSVLKFANEKLRDRAKAYFLAKATCLSQIVGYSPDTPALCSSLKKGFEEALEVNLVEQGLMDEELEWFSELKQKYGSPEWTALK
ncbi:MAG: octanoyltransferase [Firmicutes bacterium HGW-Firmicutes-14]|nr:MAG: octanoyltransferase [Firmicutes bacterium HGW-Firmicutes-14]